MSRTWRALIARVRGERPVETGTDLRSAVLQSMARTREQQAKLAAGAGAVFVKRAEIEQALTRQHQALVGAREQIGLSIEAAQRAADDARVEGGDRAARPYEQTVAGLRSQLDVIGATIAQLERLGAGAQAEVADARSLLHDSAASLDRALRAEVGLLGRLERLERERVIAEQARRQRGQ